MNTKQLIKKFTPYFVLHFYHYALALIGSIIFWSPAKKMIVIGVTGTSGKSTTVDFITRILEENGSTVASLSSIRFKIKDKEWKNELKMTMPGRFMIHKFLKQAANEKCQYAVLEVTSEGIKQYRHKFINFNTVVFTNLSPEHIESHGGFENYRNEKLKLFKAAKNIHILNIDDQNAKYFLEIPSAKKITFGIKENNPMVRPENIEISENDLAFKLQGVNFKMQVLGDFNIYNALAAISVAFSQGISKEICKKALEKVSGIPGRMEIVSKNPLIIVDYAHTPEQLEKVYKSLANKNLVCVLGSCGGGRDKWKRPVLGKIAKQYCKEIIITDEDPYDEDPLEIMEQIAGGIDNHDYHIVLKRKEAISKAISLAKPEEVIIITGKGSESLMCLAGGKKIPWSDKEIVKEELAIIMQKR